MTTNLQLDNIIPLSASNDFWRLGDGTLATLPAGGQTDETNSIIKRGAVGIGQVNQTQTWRPIAKLDVAGDTRSGVDKRVNAVGTPLYVTGDLGPHTLNGVPDARGIYFGHSNQTQGFMFGHDGLAKVGAGNFGQSVDKGGYFHWNWQTGVSPQRYWNNLSAATVNMRFVDQTRANNVTLGASDWIVETASPLSVRRQWDLRAPNGSYVAAMRLAPSNGSGGAFTELAVGENQIHKRKLVLYNVDGADGDTDQFTGFGLENGAMRYQTYGNWDHLFYHGTAETTSKLLMSITENGFVGINNVRTPSRALDVRGGAVIGPLTDQINRDTPLLPAAGGLTVFAPLVSTNEVRAGQAVIRMVAERVGGVSWGETADLRLGKKTAGINADSTIEFWCGVGGEWTPNVRVMTLAQSRMNLVLPVYANNAAAIAGGLVVDDLYKTATGEVRTRV